MNPLFFYFYISDDKKFDISHLTITIKQLCIKYYCTLQCVCVLKLSYMNHIKDKRWLMSR